MLMGKGMGERFGFGARDRPKYFTQTCFCSTA